MTVMTPTQEVEKKGPTDITRKDRETTVRNKSDVSIDIKTMY